MYVYTKSTSDACSCVVREPASSTVENSDAVPFGRMCPLAIASTIPPPSKVRHLHAIIQLRGWHVIIPAAHQPLKDHDEYQFAGSDKDSPDECTRS
jgi:hypothetical protein